MKTFKKKLPLLLKPANWKKLILTKSTIFFSKWKHATSEARSLPEKDVSTAVIHALFAQSKSVQVFSRELMVPLCLHAAKLRLWLLLLGTKQDEQIVDSLGGEYRERFMMHYNMPPFATGETGRVGFSEAP